MTSSKIVGSVSGRPVPLNRHRTSKGFVYNPSAKPQASLKDSVIEGMENYGDWRMAYTESGEDLRPISLFGGKVIDLKLVFRLRRPRSHYVANRAGPGRLKVKGYSAEYDDNRVTGGGMDLDNLIKFFMDSMNGVLWDDDRQVVRVGGVKVWDDVGEGEGGIDFCVRVLEEDEVGNLGSGFLEEDDVFDDGNGGNGDYNDDDE
ncbi:hypothetical protein TrST_g1724 [Triparma strigata]|uniref:Uncharacterized protein n=1 Tax=Triparma strigata TaxID=1606541 RepID=A0A9W7ESH8_9STRA|nr:hypothetical protein TrST_g1724 [Triparma strigata]